MSTFVIRNVQVFNGEDFQLGDVAVSGNKIVETSKPTDDIIDGTGKFLVPGFIDAHVHVRHLDELDQLASYGVTTALEMGCWPPERTQSFRGGVSDMLSAGIPATSPGTGHANFMAMPECLIERPDEAADWVAKRLAEGSDYIKIIVNESVPTPETINALVVEAHQQNRMVVAHALSNKTISRALQAKVDVITHAPTDGPLDDGSVALMKDHISVPTLCILELAARTAEPPWSYESPRTSVAAMYKAGVPILAGSDVCTEAPFDLLPGDSLHRELELLAEAGLSTLDALKAGTVLPAKYFKLNDRGSILPGFRADLVLLSENPLLDIRASRKIDWIWAAGVEVSPDSST